MDTARVINIVLTDLSLENLKLQEKLENAINSENTIEDKVSVIKSTLMGLTINELMITKFQSMVSQSNNNDNLKEN